MERPPVGTKVYGVHEHLYYVPNCPWPLLKYVVSEGAVTGYFVGHYVSICTVETLPGRGRVPYRYRLNDVGEELFFTREEAETLAAKLTAEKGDQYEQKE